MQKVASCFLWHSAKDSRCVSKLRFGSTAPSDPRPRELSISWHETIASATLLLSHVGVALHLRRRHARHFAPALHFHFKPQLVARARPACGTSRARCR